MRRTQSQLGLSIPRSAAACLAAALLFCANLRAQSGLSGGGQSSPAEPNTSQTPAKSRKQRPSAPVSASPAEQPETPAAPVTIFPHSDTSRYWISGQSNIILQWHPSFPARYSGVHSLSPSAEHATSRIFTLYLGYQLAPNTEVFLDAEQAGGHGISGSLGLAGYTDLDVVRVGVSEAPYIARAMIRQIIPLSDQRTPADRDALHLATSVPARRIEIRAGKFSLPDFFDANTWGTDSHLQFLNWTVDNSGAWDYAANTRGYTEGVLVEYDDRSWSARFAEALMPKIANGINLDADLARSRAANLELEKRGSLPAVAGLAALPGLRSLAARGGAVRLLAYVNQADMGNYEQAIRQFLSGQTAGAPDITATRRRGRHKYGFGLNFEQELAPDMGVFGRLGWSDGRNESFAYTEDDRTVELGGFSKGTLWRRPQDRAGVALVINGIVAAHREYLALGGQGFQLGDGGLDYGHEKIVEAFYMARLWRGVFAGADLQHINNPGHNKARGPLFVPALRLHTDF